MILVDTSVWIEFFRGNNEVSDLSALIENNTLCINDLILAELIPAIHKRKEYKLRELLNYLTKVPLNIDWNSIVDMQTLNLKNGINKVGIPDLIIAQNTLQHQLKLYSLDSHFVLMQPLFGFSTYSGRMG